MEKRRDITEIWHRLASQRDLVGLIEEYFGCPIVYAAMLASRDPATQAAVEHVRQWVLAKPERQQAKIAFVRYDPYLQQTLLRRKTPEALSLLSAAGYIHNHTDLREAKLSWTCFDHAVMRHTDFSGSDLTGATFRYTHLSDINLSEAKMGNIRFCRGPAFPITEVSAFTPIGKFRVAIATSDAVHVYNAETHVLENTYTFPGCEALAYDPTGNILGIVTPTHPTNRFVHLQPLDESSESRELLAELDLVGVRFSDSDRIVFSPNGKYVAAIVRNRVNLWALASGERLKTLGDQDWKPCFDLTFSPDSTRLIYTQDSTRIWKIDEKELIEGPGQGRIALSPQGILSCSQEKMTLLFDIHNGREIDRIPEPSRIMKTGWSATGRFLLRLTYEGGLRIFDLQTRSQTFVPTSTDGQLFDCVAGADDSCVYIITRNWVRKLDITGDRFLESENKNRFLPRISVNDEYILLHHHQQKKIEVWIYPYNVGPIIFHSDNQYVTITTDGRVLSWGDNPNGKVHKNLVIRDLFDATEVTLPIAYAQDVYIDAAGRFLTVTMQQSVTMWDLKSGNQIREKSYHNEGWILGASPGFAIVRSNGVARFLDLIGDRELCQLQRSGVGGELHVNSHGTYVISDDRKTSQVCVWNTSTGEYKTVGNVPVGYETVVGDDFAIVAAADRYIWVIDLEIGQVIKKFCPHSVYYRVSISPNGKHLVTFGEDGSVLLWNVEAVVNGTGREIVWGWSCRELLLSNVNIDSARDLSSENQLLLSQGPPPPPPTTNHILDRLVDFLMG